MKKERMLIFKPNDLIILRPGIKIQNITDDKIIRLILLKIFIYKKLNS